MVGLFKTLRRCDTLPVSLGGTLRLSLDFDRGDKIADVNFDTDHLFTAVLVGSLDNLDSTIKTVVFIDVGSVAFGHHQAVRVVVACASKDHVLHIVVGT